jgi:hypothetical protein
VLRKGGGRAAKKSITKENDMTKIIILSIGAGTFTWLWNLATAAGL